MDETSVNLTYGRALGGQWVAAAVPLHNGPNVTVVAALAAHGVEAPMELEGAVNTTSFALQLEQALGPGLQAGDVVVLDNLRVHKAAGLAAARGARLGQRPPCSPDFTPIELAFSKLKTHLRSAAARTRAALTNAWHTALAWITAEDAQTWFHRCAYPIPCLRVCSNC